MTDSAAPGGAPGEKPPGLAGTPGPEGMRASDADRERVAELLRDAMAEGRLDMEEFQERLETTYQARTYGELAPITRDLPVPGGAAPVAPVPPVNMVKGPAPNAEAPNWPARVGHAPTSSGAFAFWGGFSRSGRWTIARLFTAFAMWGGGEIDLRDASFEDGETVIRCFTVMGGMQVTVPPGLNVTVSGVGVMGGFGGVYDFHADGDPDAPRVRITGFALLGGVGVERKRTRAEKRRLKDERRRLMDERREMREEHRLERMESMRDAIEERHRTRGDRHRMRHEALEYRREERRAALDDARERRAARRRGRWPDGR
jgi:Domain of unknown function (DUF1707)